MNILKGLSIIAAAAVQSGFAAVFLEAVAALAIVAALAVYAINR